jgi:hypothetical protein
MGYMCTVYLFGNGTGPQSSTTSPFQLASAQYLRLGLIVTTRSALPSAFVFPWATTFPLPPTPTQVIHLSVGQRIRSTNTFGRVLFLETTVIVTRLPESGRTTIGADGTAPEAPICDCEPEPPHPARKVTIAQTATVRCIERSFTILSSEGPERPLKPSSASIVPERRGSLRLPFLTYADGIARC